MSADGGAAALAAAAGGARAAARPRRRRVRVHWHSGSAYGSGWHRDPGRVDSDISTAVTATGTLSSSTKFY